MRNSSYTFLVVSTLSLGAGAFCASAAVYNETGGQVVVEAEHFDARTDSTTAHHWAIIPDESGLPDSPADGGFLNARGGKYVQSLPDAAGGGENRNADTSLPGTGNVIDYKVQINTVGQYRLYLRWGGYDGSSDSIYAEIADLRDGITGGQADWYRYSANIPADFATAVNTTTGGTAVGWNGSGAPAGSADQISGGPAGEVPAVWTISEPGVYTIRLSQREDGSAVDAFILQRSNLPEPTDPGPAESALATSYVIIAQQPKDTAVAPGQTATFSVVASGSGAAPTYQWQKAAAGSTNFTDIAGATGTNYTTGALTTADNLSKYRVVVSIPGTTVRSRAASLIVDVTPPTVVRAAGNSGYNKVTVYFSEPMDPATATSLANYTPSAGLTLSAPTLSANGTSVSFTTSTQTNNASYTITVKDAKDATGINTLAPNPTAVTFHGFVQASGGIMHKFFDNIQGNTIANLTNNARFPDSPTFITIEPEFEYPPYPSNEGGANYGNQIVGLVTAPQTGTYVFFTCSDDPSSLYLSTDENPANKKLIAVEGVWSNPRQWQSSGGGSDLTAKRSDQFATSEWPTPNVITLTAGNRYYIEALHTEGGGGDNVEVLWVLPGGAEPVDLDPPIPGSALSYSYSPDGNVTITQQPQNQSVPGGTPATFSVAATGSSDFGTNLVYQWQRAPSGSTTFTDIAGGTSAQYTLAFAASTDSGAQFRAQVSSLIRGLPFDYSRLTSSVATLTVTADTTPPTLVGVLGTVQNIRVSFSEPLDTASATAPLNYKLSGTGNVTGATLASSAGQAGVVVLTGTGISAGQNYTLTVTGVKDLAGNTIASSTLSFDVFHIISTFNDGLVPAGSGIGGSANVKSSGSYDNSGFLELTTNLGGLQGAITYGDVLSGAAVNKFTVLFKLFIGRGSGNPADGFSFNIASDLPDPTTGLTTGEEGIGSGLTVAVDSYDNGGGEAPAIGLKWGGTEFATTNLTKATLVNNQWVDVIIRVNADGTADVYHNNVKYFDKVPIPGWTPISGPLIMLGGRTGGEFEVHWIDDLKVLYNADITVAEPPTISITSPANNARLPANSSVTITVNAQAPGSSVTKVEYFANGSSLGSSTSAPFSFTMPNVATGGYYLTAKVTAANGISIVSAPVKFVVGTPDVAYLVTADPGPLTFPGDQAVYEHVLSRGYDVELARGMDVPEDGSTALGKVLIIQSSSLGSGTVEYTDVATGQQFSKFRFLTIPAIEWEASNQDAYGFQAANPTTGSTANQTDINIVDATSSLAAGLPAGPVTVVSSPQTFAQGTPLGAHIVATLAADPSQAVIYNYDKNETGFNGFVMPARRVFFFFENNTAAAANANGWKLFDAAMDWALNKTVVSKPQITSTVIAAGQITIRWSNGGTLESTTSLTSPSWTTTGNSSGTFSEAVSASGNKFYRVRQ